MTSFFVIAGLLVGQNLFAKTYGGTNTDWGHSIIQTQDGGFAVAGWTMSFGAGNYDFLVLKLSSTGTIQWARTLGGPDDDLACSIIQTSDGGLAVAGWTGIYASGPTDFVVLKLSSAGALLWTRIFGGASRDEAWDIIQTQDGGFAVAGMTESFGAGSADFLVLKLTSTGTLSWARTYGGTGYDRTESMIQTIDGGYAVAGMTASYGAGSYDFLVLKLNPDGSQAWARTFGGAGEDQAYSIVQTADTGFAVAGYADISGVGNYEFTVLKLNSTGNMQWTRLFGGANDDRTHSIINTQGGGLAVAGYTNTFGAGSYDFLVLKLFSTGTREWARTYGGTGYDRPESMIQTQDGGFAVMGATASYGAGSYDFLVLKVDANGNYPGCVLSCSTVDTSVFPIITFPSMGATCLPDTASVTPTVTSPSLTVTNACTPVDVEEADLAPRPGITCSFIPGGALFSSPDQINIKIYAVDGRLACSGELQKGENRIYLDRGVYLWVAGQYRGKAVVR